MKKNLKFKAEYLILAIIILAAIIRIIAINKAFFTDESVWAASIINKEYSLFSVIPGEEPWFFAHPPLGPLLYLLSSTIFGFYNWSFRLIPILFGIGTIYITYLIGKNLYNERVGMFASLLMTFSFWHILASTQVDIDGAILTFFFAACLYCILAYEKSEKKYLKYLAGLFLGFAFLTKYVTFLLYIIIATYTFLKNKSIIKTIKFITPIFITGFVIFLIFPIISYFIDINIFMDTIFWGSENIQRFLTFRPFIYLILWATPTLSGLACLSLIKYKKEDIISWIWISVILLAYILFLGASNSAFDRYLTIIIPPLCLLAGKFLSEIKYSKKGIIILLISFLILTSILFSLNLHESEYLAHDTKNYFTSLKNFEWDFNFPYTGSSGPAFWINFLSIMLIIIFSGCIYLIILLLTFFKKNSIILILLFLSMGLAFNILLTTEYLFSFTHPNIDKITKDTIEYVQNNNITRPFYFNEYQNALYYYLDLKEYNLKPQFNDLNIKKINDDIKINGGTIIIIDFPGIDKESISFKAAQKCRLIKTIEDKNKILAYIFDCNNLIS